VSNKRDTPSSNFVYLVTRRLFDYLLFFPTEVEIKAIRVGENISSAETAG